MNHKSFSFLLKNLFFFLIFLSFSISSFSIGFHYPEEIFDGNFTSNFNFTGNVSFFEEVGIGVESPTVPLEIYTVPSNTLGIILDGANNYGGIGLYVGGTKKGQIIQENTGNVYFDAENDLIFRTGSPFTEKLKIDEGTGNVGIGVASPSTKLHINGTTYSTDLILSNKQSCELLYTDGSGNVLCGSQNSSLNITGTGSTGNLSYWINSTSLGSSLVYQNGTYIGIGDISPDGTLLLDVEGQVGATEYCDEDGNNCFTYTNVSSGLGGSGTANYLSKFSDSDTLTDSVIFESNNRIGINNTAPNSTLEIIGTQRIESGTGEIGLTIDQGSQTNVYALEVDNMGAGTVGILFDGSGAANSAFMTNSGGQLQSSYTNWGGYRQSVAGTIGFSVDEGAFRYTTDANAAGATESLFHLQPGASQNFIVLDQADDTNVFNISYGGNIYTAGNISVGDTSPDGSLLLDVEGQIGATEYCDEDGLNCFTYGNLSSGLGGSGTANYLSKFSDSDTLTDSILSEVSNQIGIRVASPQATLHINYTPGGSVVDGLIIDGYGNSGVGRGTSLLFKNPSSGTTSADAARIIANGTGGASSDLILQTASSGILSEVVRFTTGNDVLIGTTSASATLKLDVEGQVGATEYCDEDGLNCFTYGNLSSGIGGSGSAGNISYWSDSDTLTSSNIFQSGTNVGIATNNPKDDLQIGTRLVLSDHAGNGDIMYNAYYNGSTWLRVDDENSATLFQMQVPGSQAAAFYTSSDVGTTADSEITWSQMLSLGKTRINVPTLLSVSDVSPDALFEVSASAGSDDFFYLSSNDNLDGDIMTVLNNGNVGIGTTAPGYLLDLRGQANASGYCIDGDCITSWNDVNQSSGLDGSGSAGNISYWSDSDTLTSSQIYETGEEIGIGTTSPSGTLDINTNSGTELIFTGSTSANINAASGSDFYIRNQNVYDLRLGTSNADRLTIDESGQIGINTTSPSSTLDIIGDLEVNGNAAIGTTPNDLTTLNLNEIQTDNTTSSYGLRITSPLETSYASGGKAHYGVFTSSNPQVSGVGTSSSTTGYYGQLINDADNVGDDIGSLTGASLFIEGRGSGDITTARGMNIDILTTNGVSPSIATAYGTDVFVQTQEGGITTVYGNNVQINDQNGSMSNAYGFRSVISESGSGDITTGRSFYSDCNDATTCYGLQIVAGDAEVVTDWGIYESGADKNYFSAPLGIADSVPDGSLLLDVEGQVGATEYCDEDGNNCFTYTNVSSGLDGSGTAGNISYWSDSDTLTSSQLYDDGSGNIGIGTSSPGSKLEVSGDIYLTTNSDMIRLRDYETGVKFLSNDQIDFLHAGALSATFDASGGNKNFYFYDTNQFEIRDTSNSPIFRVNSDGSTGIGTTTPNGSLLLDVEGQIGATQYCDEGGANCFDYTNVSGGLDGSGSAGNLSYWSDSDTLTSSQLYDDGSGHIGIGTTSSSESLNVYAGSATETGIRVEGGATHGGGDTNDGEIVLGSGGSNAEGAFWYDWSGGDVYIENTWNNDAADIIFRSKAGVSPVENLRITGGGAVGINDSTPDGGLTLDVVGNIGATQFCDSSGNNCFDYTNVSGGLDGSGSAGNISYWSDSDTLTSSQLYETGEDIGIGTASPVDKLHVQGGDVRIDGTNKLKLWGDTVNAASTLQMYVDAKYGTAHIYTQMSAAQVAGPDLDIYTGNAYSAVWDSGDLSLFSGDLTGGFDDWEVESGDVLIYTGSNNGHTNASTGDVFIYTGEPSSGYTRGNIVLGHDGSTTAGNVGINETSPDNTLDIVGSLEVKGNDGDTSLSISDDGNIVISLSAD